MCIVNEMDERLWGTLEATKVPLNLSDPNDKQWYIECETLEIERLNAEANQITAAAERRNAEARLLEAQNEADKFKVSGDNGYDVIIDATCAFCRSEFHYKGKVADIAETSYMRFCDVHDSCKRQ